VLFPIVITFSLNLLFLVVLECRGIFTAEIWLFLTAFGYNTDFRIVYKLEQD
jgi:hypothetical protein